MYHRSLFVVGPLRLTDVIGILRETGRVNLATWLNIYDEYLAAAEALRKDIRLPTAPQDIRDTLLSGQFPGYDLRYGSSDERSSS